MPSNIPSTVHLIQRSEAASNSSGSGDTQVIDVDDDAMATVVY
ncbi:hypothetical protein [Microbacterium sp. Leaf151]|nr:hypothetical protein [Microbacterium sp. Leaf151]